MKRIAVVAGETSGDLLGAHVLRGLQQRWPALTSEKSIVGIGGASLQAAGLQAWWPSEKLAVRGYVEVLRHYREILGIRRQLIERLLADPPDLFLGVDAPDFNLDVELALKSAGIPTVHLVSPSIWAWRPERVEKIRAAVDHMLCVFPFEPAIYAQTGIAATYIGHPLAVPIAAHPGKSEARKRLGWADDALVLAVLPGSRASEVKHLAFRFFSAVALVSIEFDAIKIAVPCVPHLRAAIEQAAQEAGLSGAMFLNGQSHDALAACDLTLIASGTATLEAALFAKPMVIGYHMNPISWWITSAKRLQPWVGLPNILAGQFVVPELLQGDCTPPALADACLRFLKDPTLCGSTAQQLAGLRAELSRDTVQLATDAIAQTLQQRPPNA